MQEKTIEKPSAEKKSRSQGRNWVWLGIGGVLVAMQAVISTMLIVSLIRTSIVGFWLLILVIVVLVALLTLNIVMLILRKKTSTAGRIICMILAVICIVGGIFAFRYTNAFNTFLDKVSQPESEAVEPEEENRLTKEPFIVYISGSDSREGVEATARSDVNILAVVNPVEKKILLVSIPRDTYVQLHDTDGIKDKLTHAGVYGIEMSKATIEDFLDIQVDDTIKVSFDTVVKVVDELDGIDIDSDQAMDLKVEGKDKTCHFVEGVQHVDGDCALRFSRERKSYETGDRHRGENQQQVIASIISKLSGSKSYVVKLPEILNIAADSFETSFQRNDITAFIKMQLEKSPKWQVESIAIDGTGTYEPTFSMGAERPLYVMVPSEESIMHVTNKINEYMSGGKVEE